jgi:hypothetical protein
VNVQFFPIWDPKWSQMIHWNVNIHDMTWYDTEINYRYLYMYIIYIYVFRQSHTSQLAGWKSPWVFVWWCPLQLWNFWLLNYTINI